MGSGKHHVVGVCDISKNEFCVSFFTSILTIFVRHTLTTGTGNFWHLLSLHMPNFMHYKKGQWNVPRTKQAGIKCLKVYISIGYCWNYPIPSSQCLLLGSPEQVETVEMPFLCYERCFFHLYTTPWKFDEILRLQRFRFATKPPHCKSAIICRAVATTSTEPWHMPCIFWATCWS